MNPTKNLIEPKLYMNHTKNLMDPKLYIILSDFSAVDVKFSSLQVFSGVH
jgi:hypothetical protein